MSVLISQDHSRLNSEWKPSSDENGGYKLKTEFCGLGKVESFTYPENDQSGLLSF